MICSAVVGWQDQPAEAPHGQFHGMHKACFVLAHVTWQSSTAAAQSQSVCGAACDLFNEQCAASLVDAKDRRSRLCTKERVMCMPAGVHVLRISTKN